jgi:hypothetical protein
MGLSLGQFLKQGMYDGAQLKMIVDQQNTEIALHQKGNSVPLLNFGLVLASWLVLNYHLLYT